MKKLLILFTVCFSTLTMIAESKPSKTAAAGDFSYLPDPVAMVGNKTISRNQATKYLTSKFNPDQLKTLDPEEVKIILGELIELEINRNIMNAILKNSDIIPSPQLVRAKMIRLVKSLPPHRRKLLIKNLKVKKTTLKIYIEDSSKDPDEQLRAAVGLWVKRTSPDQIKHSSGEAEDYYRLRQEIFLIPEHATISQIIVDRSDADNTARSASKIKMAYSRLKQGEPFCKVAKEFSDMPSGKERGGLSGTFTREELPKQIARAVFSQKPGSFSKIIFLKKSYIIVKTDNLVTARYIPFKEVKEYISMELQSAKIKAYVGKILRQKRANLKVKLYFN